VLRGGCWKCSVTNSEVGRRIGSDATADDSRECGRGQLAFL